MFTTKKQMQKTLEERKIEEETRKMVLQSTNQNLENFRWNETTRKESETKLKAEQNAPINASDEDERQHQLKMKELDHRHEEEMMKLSARIAGINTNKKLRSFTPEKVCCLSGLFGKIRKERKLRKEAKDHEEPDDKFPAPQTS
ncbi:hypothetical protein Ddc_04891 [Ditylenchus destructor]|nr:hypothetical protein Ddc_04891 [Ditylenchus destructor]